MTIRMLKAWNGLPEQMITTLSGSEESRLVGLGLASFDLDGPADNLRMAQLATDAAGNVAGVISPRGNVQSFISAPKANFLRRASNLTDWAFATTGTAATATVDNSSPLGIPAIRFDIPNGNSYAQLSAAGLSIPGYGGAAGNLTWLVYVEEPGYISQIQSIFGDSGFVATDTLTWNIANSDKHNQAGQHHINHAKVIAPTVTDVRIRVFGGSVPAGQTARVWVAGVYIPDPVKPFVLLTFDDADLSFYTEAMPSLRLRGLHATFGINKADVGTNDSLFVNEAKLAELYSDGHDFASHCLTNTNVLTQGEAAYLADYDTCLNWLKSKGWTRGNAYHPFVQGKHTRLLCEWLIARGVTVMRNATTADLISPAVTSTGASTMMPIGVSLTDTTSLATAKAKIDDAITFKQDVCIMAHVIAAAAAPVTWARTDWAALLDYILLKKSQGLIDCGSVSEWKAARGAA